MRRLEEWTVKKDTNFRDEWERVVEMDSLKMSGNFWVEVPEDGSLPGSRGQGSQTKPTGSPQGETVKRMK